jgi:putative FmdB family regulatory protein
MMRYDYECKHCKKVFEVEKQMSDPSPTCCPHCSSKIVERYFGPGTAPAIMFADRPPWTYKEAKMYKTTKYKGKEYKVNPSVHGDLGSWNSPGEPVTTKPKKK